MMLDDDSSSTSTLLLETVSSDASLSASAPLLPPGGRSTGVRADDDASLDPYVSPVETEDRPTTTPHVSLGIFSLPIQDEDLAATPPVSPVSPASTRVRGSFRYLRGADLDGMKYDFAIVTHRQKTQTGANSPEKDGVQARLLERLTENGLDVDVIEGDFTRMVRGRGNGSRYYVLLVRGKYEVLAAYGRKLKFQTWLRSGNTREVESLVQGNPIITPADRIQVIDHIIREGARIRDSDPQIHSIFPVHDEQVNEHLLKEFIQTPKLEHLSESFLVKMREHFGEKVAYYFAYVDFYNKSLIPIAILGVLLTCFRGVMGTPMYMRFMVIWAFLVSVVWSFWFLKSWSRRNSELNYQWENNLETKEIKYRNPNFHGVTALNPVTGQTDQFYPNWKRYPKYFFVVLFMLLQISIMMLIIACWITVFEVLKVRYPKSGIFSAQWFYILGGGVLYGLFVDIFQWNLIVTKAARMFTEWENWKTLEQFEKSMIRKLFIMDFLNYYTWFFLLAFVYVLPGAGDTITNFLNSVIWKDPPNCCFGPYLDRSGTECRACPPSWHPMSSMESRCIPCKGWVTFDINHLDLEQLFLTPIIVTQGLNLLIAVIVPWIHRQHHEQRLKWVDRKAMELAKKQGPRQIIADMAYRDEHSHLTNMSKARFLENDEEQMEKLNAKSREILFQSEQDDYDPYDDYHHAIVQFGFVVMFSMLWPLMPVACMIVNALKVRGDGFRICRTLKRPFPRKAGGVGEWHTMLHVLACTGVIVNIGLVFISTGAMEFFSPECSSQITEAMGGDFKKFRFGPDLSCFSLTVRMVMILVTEHVIFASIWVFWKVRASIPARVQLEMLQREFKFKTKLHEKTVRKVHERAIVRATPPMEDSRLSLTKQAMQGAHRRRSSGGASAFSTNQPVAPLAPQGLRKIRSMKLAGSPGVERSHSNPSTPLTIRRKDVVKGNGSKSEREPLLSSKTLAQAWEPARISSSWSGDNQSS
ncbi:hypothetical protein Poli38472_003699 [Pythium oligandrum]|uniref:Anoctamin transmembrane domain-containing protein n=1 Tax=Pythium oligandrum TaxID=41045 RepID=A0A8K1CLX0_PYTOL|nr:hypothetical protein Poli38472_003699 [Pythium oligandrum]|eukprot:TMW65934.1 hypothetical protein Poli38472_003699 [Pythium oligandrum]